MSLFHPAQNAHLDLLTPPAPPTPPSPPTPYYLQTYLAHRTRPRLRTVQEAPYTPLDLSIHEHLTTYDLTTLPPISLLDIAALFPPSAASVLLAPHHPRLRAPTERLVRSINTALRADPPARSAPYVADCLDTLLSLALAGATALVVAAISPRNERADAADRVQGWLRALRDAHAAADDALLDNGLLVSEFAAGSGALLVNAVLGLPVPDSRPAAGHVIIRRGMGELDVDVAPGVSALLEMIPGLDVGVARAALAECAGVEETAGRLLDGWRPTGSTEVGKRVDRRARKRVGDVESFGGEEGGEGAASAEWYLRRAAAAEARERVEEEERLAREGDEAGGEGESAKGAEVEVDVGLAEFVELGVVGGVYDDEPDDGALEGEVTLRSVAAGLDAGAGGDSADDEMEAQSEVHRDLRGSAGVRAMGNGYRASGRVRGNTRTGPSGTGRVGGPSGNSSGLAGGDSVDGGGAGASRGTGRGRGRGRGGGRGRGRGGVKNHNRKTRAAKKQGGM